MMLGSVLYLSYGMDSRKKDTRDNRDVTQLRFKKVDYDASRLIKTTPPDRIVLGVDDNRRPVTIPVSRLTEHTYILGGEYQDAWDFMVTTCAQEVKHNNQEIRHIEAAIKNLMDTLDYKLETMIGIDLVTTAGFISEIGDIERFTSADKLAKYAGIAPIDWKSGDRDTMLKTPRATGNCTNCSTTSQPETSTRGETRTSPSTASSTPTIRKSSPRARPNTRPSSV
jgi:hypothetical protein